VAHEPRIIFAGGGTGGHLFPGIAIAEEIRRQRPNAEILFIGTARKIEARLVPQRGFSFRTIWVSGFRRKVTVDNVLFPVKVIVSLIQSFSLMWKIRPDVVVGTGGYVCGPPLFAAQMLGTPTLIQEQNSFPGVTTRLLAARATEVHLSFAGSEKYLRRKDNLKVSGNPTRERVGTISREEGAARFGISPDATTILVFGGSLGATSINRAMRGIAGQLATSGIQILWQTGEADFVQVRGEMEKIGNGSPRIIVRAFIDEMEYAYAASDLCVCRAGATTIAELTKAKAASILVPYPFAAADHQTENARAMVAAGAAVMIADRDLETSLAGEIDNLLSHPERLREMRRKAAGVGNPDATTVLADAVLALAARKDHGSGKGV
jgi:UDP-N-acetylglucosamine--N-acetylmuramyl-(pentapeptide) pyrophosphoryl-undecaprenol N-acetylglucosamine transferase